MPTPSAGGQMLVNIVMVLKRYGELPQLIHALRAPRGFARRLNRWQQQRHKDANDGDNDKQFNECETRNGSAPDP